MMAVFTKTSRRGWNRPKELGIEERCRKELQDTNEAMRMLPPGPTRLAYSMFKQRLHYILTGLDDDDEE